MGFEAKLVATDAAVIEQNTIPGARDGSGSSNSAAWTGWSIPDVWQERPGTQHGLAGVDSRNELR